MDVLILQSEDDIICYKAAILTQNYNRSCFNVNNQTVKKLPLNITFLDERNLTQANDLKEYDLLNLKNKKSENPYLIILDNTPYLKPNETFGNKDIKIAYQYQMIVNSGTKRFFIQTIGSIML